MFFLKATLKLFGILLLHIPIGGYRYEIRSRTCINEICLPIAVPLPKFIGTFYPDFIRIDFFQLNLHRYSTHTSISEIVPTQHPYLTMDYIMIVIPYPKPVPSNLQYKKQVEQNFFLETLNTLRNIFFSK